MKVIKIGIAPQAKIRERMLAIARGELKPKASDPKIWFTSMRSLSQVLSDENRALLEVIRTARRVSSSELADLTGRQQGDLSCTRDLPFGTTCTPSAPRGATHSVGRWCRFVAGLS